MHYHFFYVSTCRYYSRSGETGRGNHNTTTRVDISATAANHLMLLEQSRYVNFCLHLLKFCILYHVDIFWLLYYPNRLNIIIWYHIIYSCYISCYIIIHYTFHHPVTNNKPVVFVTYLFLYLVYLMHIASRRSKSVVIDYIS